VGTRNYIVYCVKCKEKEREAKFGRKDCAECGCEFVPENTVQMYCGKNCRAAKKVRLAGIVTNR